MTTPTGPISLFDVQTEFGGSLPIGINEYYAGGLNVPNPQVSSFGTIPTSGTIDLAKFRGQSKITDFVFTDEIYSARSSTYNLVNVAVSRGWNGSSKLIATVVVNAGISINSATASMPSFTTGSPTVSPGGVWPAGSSLTLINNGNIVGCGGEGGTGGYVFGAAVGYPTAGGVGGLGLQVLGSLPVTIENNSNIGGGGGGGGGGGAARATYEKTAFIGGSGGGGGGGRAVGAGGTAGTSTGNAANGVGANGLTSGPFTQGAGGAGYVQSGVIGAGAGGSGGAMGKPGNAGANPDTSNPAYVAGGYTTGAAGGAPGAAIQGGQTITWAAYGNRVGLIDHSGSNAVSSGAVGAYGGAMYAYNVGASPSSATVSLQQNGTITGALVSNVGGTNGATGDSWYVPTTTNIGNSYWVRATVASGIGPSAGTIDTWLPLSAIRTWSYSSGSGGSTSSRVGSLLLEISSSATGSPVVAQGYYNFSAARES